MRFYRLFLLFALLTATISCYAADGGPKSKNALALVDIEGRAVSLESFKGKVVFINFWATWCPPCVKEIPSIYRLKQLYRNNTDVVFLMVDVDSKLKQSSAFLKKYNYDLEVYGLRAAPAANFLGNAIPTTVIINKNGEMVGRLEGGREYDSPGFKAAFAKLIKGD